jgi:serine/threonine-protein kinase
VFSAAQLRELESRLARHLGPIAKLLVARAAARATGLDDLCRLLAAELESDHQRSEFLKPPPH